MKKIYIVTCERHINCQIREMVYICHADNAKDACNIAKSAWDTSRGHLFHVHAVKSRTQDASLIRVSTWRLDEFKGEEAFNTFFCTDFRVWHIRDHKNLT